jgi:hypothetical protein
MPSAYVLGRVQGGALVSDEACAAALAELQQQAQVQRLPKPAKMVALARELMLFLFGGRGGGGDDDAACFNLALVGALAEGGLSNLRDGDNDARKAARLLHLMLSEVVARRQPGLMPSERIDAACAAVLEDASGGHSLYAPRRIVALRSLAILMAPAWAERAHKVNENE